MGWIEIRLIGKYQNEKALISGGKDWITKDCIGQDYIGKNSVKIVELD